MLPRGLITSIQGGDLAWAIRTAKTTVSAGANGIRTDGPAFTKALIQAISVPVISIDKDHEYDPAYITPTLKHAWELVEAGANYIALDFTDRGDRMICANNIREELHNLDKFITVIADISTYQEAKEAEMAGFDAVATTLVGYTAETEYLPADCFDYGLLARLTHELSIPVIAEGRIRTPRDAQKAMQYGAHAVVVGSAITDPKATTQWFVEALCELE